MLLADRVHRSESVSLGIWVPLGSRHESATEHGYAHFIEHMLFKGTACRSAYRISAEIDGLGGDLNGSTSRENTSISVSIASPHLHSGLDVLMDMFFNSSFRNVDLERERGVLLEEIDLSRDEPEEHVSDLFSRALWGDLPLGYPVSGEREDVENATRQRLVDRYREHYRAGRMVISAAGDFDLRCLKEAVEQRLPGGEPDWSCPPSPFAKPRANRAADIEGPRTNRAAESAPDQPDAHSPALQPETAEQFTPVIPSSVQLWEDRSVSQVHVLWGCACYGLRHPSRYALVVLNTVLGGSVSSRLFQKIREESGLCYAISSGLTGYTDTGELTIGFSTSVENVKRVMDAVREELLRLRQEGITPGELEMARAKIRGNLVLAKESSEWRMTRMAVQQMVYGRPLPFGLTDQLVSDVTLEQVYDTAREVLCGERFCLASIGPHHHSRLLENSPIVF
jgi:predicted Zn-dependent peptidase